MNRTHKIFVLENQTNTLKPFLSILYNNKYDITLYNDPKLYIKSIEQENPDLAILSIDKDANHQFEICKKLKESYPVILAGKYHDCETINKGYECGAFDYITDTISPSEIDQRITLAITDHIDKKKLANKAQEVKKVAVTATNDSRELQAIIKFLGNSINCYDHNDFAQSLFSLYMQLNLSGAILFHNKSTNSFFSTETKEQKTEIKLLKKFKKLYEAEENYGSRFITQENKVLAIGQQASIIIRNITDDKTQQGRLRDILGALMNGLEARIIAIETNLEAEQKNAIISDILENLKKSMSIIQAKFKTHRKSTGNIMQELMRKMHEGLSTLFLTDEQEEYMIALLEDAMQRLVQLYTQEIAIEKNFGKLIMLLEKLRDDLW